jgi:hypothetical protein
MASGYLSFCKECVKKKALKYRAENIEKVRKYGRERGRLPSVREKVKANAHKYDIQRQAARIAWIEKNIEKRAAHITLNNAVAKGRLKKPQTCERCLNDNLNLHGHHEDYSKPLEVIWLCTECHGERHRELNDMKRSNATL